MKGIEEFLAVEECNQKVFCEVRRETDKRGKLDFRKHFPATQGVIDLEFLYLENSRARGVEYRIFHSFEK